MTNTEDIERMAEHSKLPWKASLLAIEHIGNNKKLWVHGLSTKRRELW